MLLTVKMMKREHIILREVSENTEESFYEMLEDDDKINAISKVFAELLDDVEFEN